MGGFAGDGGRGSVGSFLTTDHRPLFKAREFNWSSSDFKFILFINEVYLLEFNVFTTCFASDL